MRAARTRMSIGMSPVANDRFRTLSGYHIEAGFADPMPHEMTYRLSCNVPVYRDDWIRRPAQAKSSGNLSSSRPAQVRRGNQSVHGIGTIADTLCPFGQVRQQPQVEYTSGGMQGEGKTLVKDSNRICHSGLALASISCLPHSLMTTLSFPAAVRGYPLTP